MYIMLYTDLPTQLPVKVDGPGGRAYNHPLDVICCCKRYVSDAECCHVPVLVLPFARPQSMTAFLHTELRPHNASSYSLQMHWVTLAEYLLEANPENEGFVKSAKYLLDLCDGVHLETNDLPSLPFHAAPPRGDLLSLQSLDTPPAAVRYLMPVATFKCHIKARPGVPG